MPVMTAIRYLFLGLLLLAESALAQNQGLVSGREPPAVQVYEMAMTPSQRKWQQA